MNDLFTEDLPQPLAARMRPKSPDQYVGQQHLFAEGRPLRVALERGQLHSMILWGPPGVGKTSMAHMMAGCCDAEFVPLSAVMAGVKDIRAAVAEARQRLQQSGRRTLLFVDEVHRFSKSQQDAFLPYVEDGTVIFVGATTENPSFSLNNALLSRARVYVLRAIDADDLTELLMAALNDPVRGLGEHSLCMSIDIAQTLAQAADGDARKALNLLEIAADLAEEEKGQRRINDSVIREVLANDVRRFDRGGDVFYEQISALHKAVRGSSVDGALYWLCRMLDGGCDPLYIVRRVVRMASEDIGNADPRGLQIALDGWNAQERLGSPEGELALAQAVAYLAAAPKSNAVYKAFNQIMAEVKSSPSFEVPVHLRNAPTSLMKDLGYGEEYRYAHDEPDAYAAGENYLPEELSNRRYYHPVQRGLELKIADKLEHLRALDESSTWRRYRQGQDD